MPPLRPLTSSEPSDAAVRVGVSGLHPEGAVVDADVVAPCADVLGVDDHAVSTGEDGRAQRSAGGVWETRSKAEGFPHGTFQGAQRACGCGKPPNEMVWDGASSPGFSMAASRPLGWGRTCPLASVPDMPVRKVSIRRWMARMAEKEPIRVRMGSGISGLSLKVVNRWYGRRSACARGATPCGLAGFAPTFKRKAGLWFKRLWKRLRSFRFTKKRVLLVSAVLAAAALGFGVWRFLRPAGGALPAMADAVRTTRLEKTTLSESITVTGTVESGSVANVTTSLSYPVKEIFVQVGDTVSEGDVICTLDSSDLEEQLAKRQEALAESRETAQKNYDKAVESYNSAAAKQTEAYNAYASAASALETARNTEYLNAANSVSSYQSAYDAALTAEQEAGAALNNANTALSAAQAACDAAQAALDADSANPELQAARDNAAAALTAAQNTAAAAQSDYTAKSAARQAAEDALKTAKANSGYDALYQAYAAADQAWLQARSTYETATETLRQAKENMETAAENLENAGTSDDIEELEEQIADCTITAGASGTITTLNATVGSAAVGGTSNTALAVIQNTDDLTVSITIDEDDIKSVAVGQQAIIKSDATGDTEIAGTVSQLSLTSGSTGGTQGGTGSSGFGAEVTVTGKESGLLIGLSAKVEIILSQVTDVYAVPYDAVGTDENGGSVVYARSGGETEFTAIPVETGMETDYYIEISGEGLSDGMEVKTSANDTATAAAGADDAQQSGENAMFSMDMGGGMPGGDMPGGGGMPSGGPGGM